MTPYRQLDPSRALQALFVATALLVSARALVLLADWTPRYGWLIATLVAFCALGWGVWGGRLGYLRPLLLQNVLGLTVVGLAKFYGPVEVLLFPLAAQGALALAMRPALALAVAMSLSIQVPWMVVYDEPYNASLLVSHTAGVVFVIVFTQILKQEIDGRVRAERSRQSAVVAAQAARNRLSREIHDGLGHHLTVLAVQLEGAKHLVASDPERAVGVLSGCHDLVRRALDDVRSSVATIRGEVIFDRPLREAVEELARTGREAGLHVDVEWSGDAEGLDPSQVHTLFRATQEGLTNALKHGRAIRRLSIRLSCDPGRVQLEVHDDGAPRDDGRSGDDGFGFAGLRERAQLLGGSLVTRCLEPRGFALELEFPR